MLEFYEQCRKKYKDDKQLCLLPKQYKTPASLKTAYRFSTLERIGGGDERLMFLILQKLLLMHYFRDLDEIKTERRRSGKDLPRDLRNYIEKTMGESLNSIAKVSGLDTSIDTSELARKALSWVEHRAYLYSVGLHEMFDALDFVCMLEPKLNKSALCNRAMETASALRAGRNRSSAFNMQIHQIYQADPRSSGKVKNPIHQDIADLLNDLKIETKQGKRFTRQSVYRVIKRSTD